MIQAQQLPPLRSPYDYPMVLPGQELTPAQEQQAQLAQIAGIIMAAAAAKSGLEAAVTNQLVALMRVADLTTAAGIKVFAASAAAIVKMGIRQARVASWSAFAARARVVGISFPAGLPSDKETPNELLYTRGTGLERAYARLAEEFQEQAKRPRTDPVIQALVKQFEQQGLTPLPRPDNISSDAVRRVVDGEEEWTEAFRKAEEEARKAEGRTDSAETSYQTDAEPTQGTDRAGSAWRERDVEELRGSDSAEATLQLERAREAEREAAAKESGAEEESGAGRDEGSADQEQEEPELRLVGSEIDAIIQRYAQHKAEERAERMVSQDITAANRNTHNLAINHKSVEKKIAGFRRVVHPELAESGRSCGLCIVASTHRYTKRDLLPIHSGCNCGIAEIYKIDGEEFDPGDQINYADLEVFYQEAGGSTHGWSLKKQRYKVVDHPEYGPTLVNDTSKKARRTAEAVSFESRSEDNGE